MFFVELLLFCNHFLRRLVAGNFAKQSGQGCRSRRRYLDGGLNDFTQKIFTEVLGFYLVERVLSPEGDGDVGIWLSCSHKVHDIAFVEYPEKGKLHHCSFLLESWEQVLRAGDIMSMNEVNVDIGPTRHGVTRGCTIYAWDPSGNRFETFMGGYHPYPDYQPLSWTYDNFAQGLDYPQRKLHESFLTVVT